MDSVPTDEFGASEPKQQQTPCLEAWQIWKHEISDDIIPAPENDSLTDAWY